MSIKTSCLTLFCLVLTSYFSTAQSNELIGRIVLDDGNSVIYKLVFSDSGGNVKGYSLSDPGGPKQTRAAITGELNRNKRTFSFTEQRVLNAKDKSVKYCLLKCRCKITERKGMQLFKGKITGYINGDVKSPCGKGTVTFSTAKDILKITQQLVASIDTAKLDANQKQLLDSLKKQTLNTSINNIDAKKGATFHWNTDTVRIEVFDDGEVDYDRISIIMDDKTMLNNYSVIKEKHEIKIPLQKGLHTIKFHAENEGNVPPNTTKAILWDGGIKHVISTNLYYGQDATVEIER